MSDALDRLKRKNRPKVQPRSTQVAPKTTDILTSRHTDIETSDLSRHIDTSTPENQEISDILKSRHIELETSGPVEDIEVKRSTFRLEVGLINRLHRFCKDNGISREVLIESMFEYMEANPEALEQVLKVAESKNAHRQQIANRKRAQAMIEKFGQ